MILARMAGLRNWKVSLLIGHYRVNPPPPKGGGFRLRLKAGSVRRPADSRNVEVVVRFWRDLALDVLCPRLVRDVAARHHPVAACPEMLAPVALAQRGELAQELV